MGSIAITNGDDEGCGSHKPSSTSVATGYVLGLKMPESGRPSQSDQRHRTAALLSPLLSCTCSQDGPFLLVLRTISIDCK